MARFAVVVRDACGAREEPVADEEEKN